MKRSNAVYVFVTTLFIAVAMVTVPATVKYSKILVEHKELMEKYITIDEQLAEVSSEYEELVKNSKNKPEILKAYIEKNYERVPIELAEIIANETVVTAAHHRIPLGLVVGIIEVESSFDPTAVSKAGARGLMQVMPNIWLTKVGLKSPYELHDVRTGLDAGMKVFKIHLKEVDNDISKALYNYVGKDKTYITKVYEAMGKYELHRDKMRKEDARNTKTDKTVSRSSGSKFISQEQTESKDKS